jgi:hypothetical protein
MGLMCLCGEGRAGRKVSARADVAESDDLVVEVGVTREEEGKTRLACDEARDAVDDVGRFMDDEKGFEQAPVSVLDSGRGGLDEVNSGI